MMEFEDQFLLDHLLFMNRVCRKCGRKKDLLNDFYRTKNDRTTPSAYSYDCKDCTKKRILSKRKKKLRSEWEYPDW